MNEVRISGRVAAPPEDRALPSGDELTAFRVVVDRPATRQQSAPGRRPVTVDVVDCVVWAAGVRRTVTTWQAGDVVELQGALRRRFWRGPGGPASRYEVEVLKAKRLVRAA